MALSSMKIAITSTKPDINSPFEPRFGRCDYFILVDTADGTWDAIPNPAQESAGGAGTQAGQFLANQGIEAVISGRFGPNAYSVLNAAGIRMYQAEKREVQSVLAAFRAGELSEVTNPENRRGRGRRAG